MKKNVSILFYGTETIFLKRFFSLRIKLLKLRIILQFTYLELYVKKFLIELYIKNFFIYFSNKSINMQTLIPIRGFQFWKIFAGIIKYIQQDDL